MNKESIEILKALLQTLAELNKFSAELREKSHALYHSTEFGQREIVNIVKGYYASL